MPPERHASAFGFHRAMDHLGALLGPLVAFLVLRFWTDDLRTLFWLSAIPGAFAVLTVLAFVREAPPAPDAAGARSGTPRQAPRRGHLRPLLLPLGLFTLGNASDLFLLLRVSETRAPITTLPLLWMALHAVKATTSALGGRLADAAGRRRVLVAGWLVYAAIYVAFAFVESPLAMAVLFVLYGLHHGLTEPAEKSLVAELAPRRSEGAAFGWYHAVLGIGGLAASLLFGLLWQQFGSRVAFLVGAGLAVAATLVLARMSPAPADPSR